MSRNVDVDSQVILRVVREEHPDPTCYVEITRSFAMKVNVGNYESRDFFASQKATCPLEKAEEVSRELHKFCMGEVQHSAKEYIQKRSAVIQKREGGA